MSNSLHQDPRAASLRRTVLSTGLSQIDLYTAARVNSNVRCARRGQAFIRLGARSPVRLLVRDAILIGYYDRIEPH